MYKGSQFYLPLAPPQKNQIAVKFIFPLHFFSILFFFLERRFLCVDQSDLKLRDLLACLPSAGMKDVRYHPAEIYLSFSFVLM